MNVFCNPSKTDELDRILSLEWDLEKRLCNDYHRFFRSAWPELEPASPLRRNWHLDVLCKELQKQAERIAERRKKEYDIIINIPPGSSKSTIVRRLFIPYVWTRFPGQKFITASFDKGLSLDHAVDSRTVIQSAWYQMHWGDVFKLRFDQNVKGYFKNDFAGFCLAVSVTSSSIGRRCDWMIIDDPNDPKKDESVDQRMSVINWFTKTAYKRLNSPEIGQRVIVQQRTHEYDLTGYLLANYPGDFKLFCIPGELTDDVSPPELRQYYKDGMFDPVNYSRVTLIDDKKKLGPDYAGQILQRPAPAEGNIFKKQWWRYWKPVDMPKMRDITVRLEESTHTCPTTDLPTVFEDKIISCDFGLKGKSGNDYSVIQVWGKAGPNFYLLDQSRGHFNDLQAEQETRRLKAKYPDTSITKIEDAAAGPVVIRRMQEDTAGVVGENPKGSKRNRARPMAIYAEGGNIYLPHPDLYPWVNDFINEYSVFDAGENDDQVDTGTQAINHFIMNKRVFAEYNGAKGKFSVAWNELSSESKPIITQVMERNGTSALVLALYNQKNGILRILANCRARSSNPETIIPLVNKMIDDVGAKLLGIKKFSWYGNNLMFSAGCGDVAETYMTKRVYVQEVPAYNDSGAVMRVKERLSIGKFIIHERAGDTSQEMLSWAYKTSTETDTQKLALEPGFNLARAVCLVAEVVQTQVGLASMPKKSPAYSVARTAFLDSLKDVTDENINT